MNNTTARNTLKAKQQKKNDVNSVLIGGVVRINVRRCFMLFVCKRSTKQKQKTNKQKERSTFFG